ncbi:MAG: hypothetical protein ARM1_0839 [Candidatus Micrarchaeota archaeon]|nr:MAG: hypothetical protein ARM1_0839 [Candidatus Micrarchaeota archaeon]
MNNDSNESELAIIKNRRNPEEDANRYLNIINSYFVNQRASSQKKAVKSQVAKQSVSKEQKKKLTANQKKRRIDAANKVCVWHPWRRAYAICAYCNRAFCYEDLEELNGDYYCLEDVNKVAFESQQNLDFNKLYLLGSILLVSLIFVYSFILPSSLNSIIDIITSSNLNVIVQKILSFNLPIIILILTYLLLSISFISGLITLVIPEKGYAISIAIALLEFGLFLYNYVNTLTLGYLIAAIISIIALVSMAASKKGSSIAAETAGSSAVY